MTVQSESIAGSSSTVAVVGAGMAGATLARILTDRGFRVQVFEKSRGLGGRMATRREEGMTFDHGAQYFTVRDERFQRYVDSWLEEEVISPWHPRVMLIEPGGRTYHKDPERRYVGVPGMNAPVKSLLAGLPVHTSQRVTGLVRDGKCWRLIGEGMEPSPAFDYVALAVPSDQAASLLPFADTLRDRIRAASMHACWAVMVNFQYDLDIPFDAAFIEGNPLCWAARNGSKPGRVGPESWVLHATHAWSRSMLEVAADTVADSLLASFLELMELPPVQPSFLKAHRWRHAAVETPLTDHCVFDDPLRIGACGDWAWSAQVEGAFLSGWALAERIEASAEADRLLQQI